MKTGRHTVLCVDDEKNILNALKRLLRRENYDLITASSGKEGLRLISEENVQVVISDQRMPEMSGTEFLGKVKEEYPDIIRIILTGYTDVDSITESINKGNIYKFFLKPWNDHNLKLEIRQAIEQYDLKLTNRHLHQTVLDQNEELRTINENLETIVQERTEMLYLQNHALELSRAVLDDVPYPIFGISTEEMIVLLNQKAQDMVFGQAKPHIGQAVSSCFPEKISRIIVEALHANTYRKTEGEYIPGSHHKIELVPLSGRHQGEGLVMTILPNGHP